MKMQTLRDGLDIMLVYGDGDLSIGRDGDDMIFAGPADVTPDDMTSADVKHLYDLGWVWDTKLERWHCYC